MQPVPGVCLFSQPAVAVLSNNRPCLCFLTNCHLCLCYAALPYTLRVSSMLLRPYDFHAPGISPCWPGPWLGVTTTQHSEKVEIRAAGASILRRLAFAVLSPPYKPNAGDTERSATAAAPSCRALLECLDGRGGGRLEAVRSLSSLGLFRGGGGTDDSGGGGWRSKGADKTAEGVGRRRAGAAQEARWKKQLKDDGAAVLVALVGAVTSAAEAATAARSARSGGGGGDVSWRQRRRGGSGGPRGVAGSAGWGTEGFDPQESEALSAVCAEALRSLVR